MLTVWVIILAKLVKPTHLVNQTGQIFKHLHTGCHRDAKTTASERIIQLCNLNCIFCLHSKPPRKVIFELSSVRPPALSDGQGQNWTRQGGAPNALNDLEAASYGLIMARQWEG